MNVSQMLAHLQPPMLVAFGQLKLKGGLMAFPFWQDGEETNAGG